MVYVLTHIQYYDVLTSKIEKKLRTLSNIKHINTINIKSNANKKSEIIYMLCNAIIKMLDYTLEKYNDIIENDGSYHISHIISYITNILNNKPLTYISNYGYEYDILKKLTKKISVYFETTLMDNYILSTNILDNEIDCVIYNNNIYQRISNINYTNISSISKLKRINKRLTKLNKDYITLKDMYNELEKHTCLYDKTILALDIDITYIFNVFNSKLKMIKRKLTYDSTCSICLEIVNDDILIKSCVHVFHRHCLNNWIQYKNTCPNCKIPIKYAKTHSEILLKNNKNLVNKKIISEWINLHFMKNLCTDMILI